MRQSVAQVMRFIFNQRLHQLKPQPMYVQAQQIIEIHNLRHRTFDTSFLLILLVLHVMMLLLKKENYSTLNLLNNPI